MSILYYITPFVCAFILHTVLQVFLGMYFRIMGKDYTFSMPCVPCIVVVSMFLTAINNNIATSLVVAFYGQIYFDIIQGTIDNA